MNILLDTHIILWALLDDPRLSKETKAIITDPDATIYYSAISTWEIMLKNNSPKNNLSLSPEDFVEYCEDAGYVAITLKNKHVIAASKLNTQNADKIHNDPFDRILLAQAKSENMTFLTHNEKLTLYNEKCVVIV